MRVMWYRAYRRETSGMDRYTQDTYGRVKLIVSFSGFFFVGEIRVRTAFILLFLDREGGAVEFFSPPK